MSLLSYLYVGSSLMIADKTSYIYDFNASRLDGYSGSITKQIELPRDLGKTLSAILRNPSGQTLAPEVFETSAKPAGITGLVLLGADPAARQGFGPSAEELSSWIAQNEKSLGQAGLQVFRTETPGRVVVTGEMAGGAPYDRFAATVTLDMSLAASSSEEGATIVLADSTGKTIWKHPEDGVALRVTELASVGVDAGARDWHEAGSRYIVGYRRLAGGQLFVARALSRDLAFEAADILIRRSLALGVSILLVAIGLTFAFAKSLTRQLRRIWELTRGVSGGNFSVRVEVESRVEDEVTDLAGSFNAMAAKIHELMDHTAQKARMEKELETAQEVQRRFFPSEPYQHANLRLAGRMVPASECSGDWWHYAVVGNRVVIVAGDVTGHGVSAALVTAAAHAVFCQSIKTLGGKPPGLTERPLLATIMDHLHHAIFTAANGDATMTLFGTMIDLETGVAEMANASHCFPYLLKAGAPGFAPLTMKPQPPLGSSYREGFETTVARLQLDPGDSLLWYTDGILEPRKSDGKKVNKKAWIGRSKELVEQSGVDVTRACAQLIDEAVQFYRGPDDRVDDITVVVAAIPPTADFRRNAA